MSTQTKIEAGTPVRHGDEETTIKTYSKGWYELESGAKVRAKDIEVITEDEGEEGQSGRNMAKTLQKYRAGYLTSVTSDGRKSKRSDNPISAWMEGWTPEMACMAADKLLNQPAGFHAAKYEGLNNGQRRMNAGNRIRAFAKSHELDVEALNKMLKAS